MAASELRRVTAREAGLAFAARAKRWMISGAVILAGGLAAVTAHAFHARSGGAVRPTAAVTRTAPANGSGEDSNQAPLQAPASPPASAAPAPAPAPVVSGGS